MNINSKEQVKILMVKENLTSKKLAQMLSESTNKKYTQQSILHKVFLSSFRYDEIVAMCDLLNYKITIEKK